MQDKVEKLPAPVSQNLPSRISDAGLAGKQEQDEEMGENVLRIFPVRNAVLFPHNIMPLTANKNLSLEFIENLIRKGSTLGIVGQKNASEKPNPDELYDVGTQAKVLKLVKFPDQSYGAVLQGVRRFRVVEYIQNDNADLTAEVDFLDDVEPTDSMQYKALAKSLKQLVQKAMTLSMNLPSEASVFIENVNDPLYLADLVVPYLSIDAPQKQELLELSDLEERLRRVHFYLTREIEILEMSQKIHSGVRNEVGKQQRKYYLREQMKLLQKELGDLDGKEAGDSTPDAQDLKTKIENNEHMPQEAKSAALKEVGRLQSMHPSSPEYNVSTSYIQWLLDMPWGTYTQETIDLSKAKMILDNDHFGLEKVKKRISQFLAVYALKNSLKGPILLLVGPPGVGKTSLGKSVAKALGRRFVRIALGGVRDEAEVRGHRRTYVGALPGKFVDALKKSGSMDPVILLDEIDKIAADGRGDPASALLEVLDGEQNHTFTDHYLNVPVDLSRVLFIATANSLATIPAPLRDRLEIVELSGYTLQEKMNIAERHVWPKVLDEHGLHERLDAKIPAEVMKDVIQQYTREAGVRELGRQLAGVARGLAQDLIENGHVHIRAKTSEKNKETSKSAKRSKPKLIKRTLQKNDLNQFLGRPIYSETRKVDVLPVGVATGLAYTPVGGDVLFIESVSTQNGTGRLSLTGQLGDVMKESVQTALAYLASHAKQFGIDSGLFRKTDVHVHFPAGAIKKDGPSAGVAVFLSLLGLFTEKSVPADLAMTGEISLRGDVLPVGGIKEKLIAAHRYGIKTILLPFENERDLEDLPKEVLKELTIYFVKTLNDAVKIVRELNRKTIKKQKRVR